MLRTTALAFVVFVFVLGFHSAALAQKTTVMQVVVVKTDNVAAYVKEVEKGNVILKRIGIPAQIRVWQATFAGPEQGTVMTQSEFPSITAFAASAAKEDSSPEFQAWLKGLDKVRKRVSNSIYREL